MIAWISATPPARAPLQEPNKKIEEFANANESWVIEGSYTDLMDIVSTLANEIIFLNLSIEQCIENAKNRPWEPHKYKTRSAQNSNLDMLINWIKEYNERDDNFSFNSHMEFYNKFKGKKPCTLIMIE